MLFLFIQLGFSQDKTLENSPNGQLIYDYLQQKSVLYNKKLNDFYISSEHYDKKTKVTHIYVGQLLHGIKIFNTISNFAVKRNEIVHFADSFFKNSSNIATLTPASITAKQAVNILIKHRQLGSSVSLKTISSNKNSMVFYNHSISEDTIPVELMYSLSPNGKLLLSWNVNIYTLDSLHLWNAQIDALTGEVIDYKDLVLHCDFYTPEDTKNSKIKSDKKDSFSLFNNTSNATPLFMNGMSYNVFPFPAESPNDTEQELVSNTESSNASPYGWHDTDGVLGAEYNTTRGNNIYAYEDLKAQNSPGYSPESDASSTFNFYLNESLSPLEPENMNAALTNAFFISNMSHDIFYEYGFDEAAGNFQQNNYGKGGIGNDFVLVEALDGGRVNNGNFVTPPDGSNGKMQLFLWRLDNNKPSFKIQSPSDIAGDYLVENAVFGDLIYDDLSANLVLVNDGSDAPTDACNPLINSSEITGNIALIERNSTCDNDLKVLNAQNAGAIAAIVINPYSNLPYVMRYKDNSSGITIPSIMIGKDDGARIKAKINQGVSLSMSYNGITTSKDCSFDKSIVVHEYGHGVNNRLIGGTQDVYCWYAFEAMHEGWPDWFSLITTMKEGDSSKDRRPVMTYSRDQEIATGGGTRRYPYTTDMSINKHTYADLGVTEYSGHQSGSVWCATLWDLTWLYIDKYGFDKDIYNGNGGNNKMLHTAIEALKLMPCQPGFVDGRNSILAADEILTGGENTCEIWKAFARRGIGVNADQGLSTSLTDQTVSFDLPQNICDVLSTSENEFNSLSIAPNPNTGSFKITSSNSLQDATISFFDILGRKLLNQFSMHQDNNNQLTVDIESFSTGTYFIKIQTDIHTSTKRIIKN